MKNLLITSCNERIGKTTFTLALVRKFQSMGKRVGYFKPISSSKDDKDAQVAKEFLKLSEPIEVINPATITEWDYDLEQEEIKEIRAKIKKAYDTLIQNYDFLVIEGCKTMNYLSFLKLSSRELAEMLDAKVLILVSGHTDAQLDDVLLAVSYFNDQDIPIVGTIFSLVPLEILEREKGIVARLEQTSEITVLGLIPDKSALAAPTVEEIVQLLGAKYLCCEECKNKIVEDFQVGAMELESALKFFRRSVNKAVILGGDRPALALAAMETDTSMIILTGGIYPPSTVLARAQERKIPVVMVQWDTYTTVQYLATHQVRGILSSDQPEKVKEWDRIMEEINLQRVLDEINT
ncbi:MAG: phosphotransacetylase family protein [Methanobacteriota archaeon]|nr:MAG: phosphotransacetylase family protein [Euryarchaeota archaeon]